MEQRRGEKIGWLGGWLGGFVWLAALAVVFLFRQRWVPGVVGLCLFGLAVAVILSCAPWRHPDTVYWKLLLPVYAVFFGAVAWAVWAYGGLKAVGVEGWHILWLAPMLLPLFTNGRRSWNSSVPPDAKPSERQGGGED